MINPTCTRKCGGERRFGAGKLSQWEYPTAFCRLPLKKDDVLFPGVKAEDQNKRGFDQVS